MSDEHSIDDWNDDITQDSADFLLRKTQDVYREEEPEELEEVKQARLHRAGAADAEIDDLLAITSSPKPEEKKRYTNKQQQGLLDQLNADELNRTSSTRLMMPLIIAVLRDLEAVHLKRM